MAWALSTTKQFFFLWNSQFLIPSDGGGGDDGDINSLGHFINPYYSLRIAFWGLNTAFYKYISCVCVNRLKNDSTTRSSPPFSLTISFIRRAV